MMMEGRGGGDEGMRGGEKDLDWSMAVAYCRSGTSSSLQRRKKRYAKKKKKKRSGEG